MALGDNATRAVRARVRFQGFAMDHQSVLSISGEFPHNAPGGGQIAKRVAHAGGELQPELRLVFRKRTRGSAGPGFFNRRHRLLPVEQIPKEILDSLEKRLVLDDRVWHRILEPTAGCALQFDRASALKGAGEKQKIDPCCLFSQPHSEVGRDGSSVDQSRVRA